LLFIKLILLVLKIKVIDDIICCNYIIWLLFFIFFCMLFKVVFDPFLLELRLFFRFLEKLLLILINADIILINQRVINKINWLISVFTVLFLQILYIFLKCQFRRNLFILIFIYTINLFFNDILLVFLYFGKVLLI